MKINGGTEVLLLLSSALMEYVGKLHAPAALSPREIVANTH
jgi:hypothetical protein